MTLTPISDTRNEGNETVSLGLTANLPIYRIGSAVATITIADDPQDVIPIPTSYTVSGIAIQQGTYHVRAAYGINNNAWIVGDRNSGTYGTPQRAFKYVNGATTMLPAFAGTHYSYVFAINDVGWSVGYANNNGLHDQPMRWHDTYPNYLTPVGWGNAAVAINTEGFAVGCVKKPNGIYAASSWQPFTSAADDQVGDFAYMGNLAFGDVNKASEANGINSANRVVGKSMIQVNGTTFHAFRTEAGVDEIIAIDPFSDDLGTESGIEAHSSEAWDINDSDEVVGGTMTSVGEFQAFLRSKVEGKNRGFTRLGCLPGGNWSIAQAINNNGTIVGRSRTTLTGGTIRGFVYYNNGTMVNLNSVISGGTGWVIERAEDINESGWIVGLGYLNGVQHAVLLTPNN